MQPWINSWRSHLRVVHCLWASHQCGERSCLLEVYCCWECEFFDPCWTKSSWGKTPWLGLFPCAWVTLQQRRWVSWWQWQRVTLPGHSWPHVHPQTLGHSHLGLPGCTKCVLWPLAFLEFGRWAPAIPAPQCCVLVLSFNGGTQLQQLPEQYDQGFWLVCHCWKHCRKRWCQKV